MSGRGDARLEAALLQRLARGPADILDLLAAARADLGAALAGHEYAVHVVLHRLVRAEVVTSAGRSPRGLALYGGPKTAGAEPAASIPPQGAGDADAAHIAHAVRDPVARARVQHDLGAHRESLARVPGADVKTVFGSSRAARALLKRVDRGQRTVVLLEGVGDTLLRLLIHEGPWLLGSVLLFLVVKFFLADVFVIPSDSMVPTLIQRDRVVVTRRWPGWVPDRWQVVTFRHPGVDGPNTTWVKRAVGLPGEELSVWRGDVWVNDVLAVKPDDLNAALRVRLREWTFQTPGERAGWSVAGREAGVDEWLPPTDAPPGSASAGEGPLDLYLELDVEVPARGLAALHLGRSSGDGASMARTDWHLDAGREGVRLTETSGGSQPVTELWREPAPLTGRLTLRLAVVDGVVRASVGEQAWRGPRTMPADRASFQFSAADGARPLSFRLDQDLHYGNQGSLGVQGTGSAPARSHSEHRHKVPDGTIFLMGDNTLVSHDSRFSDVGDISLKKLIGPVAFRIWPPARIGSVR